jgi:hypothetical protein
MVPMVKIPTSRLRPVIVSVVVEKVVLLEAHMLVLVAAEDLIMEIPDKTGIVVEMPMVTASVTAVALQMGSRIMAGMVGGMGTTVPTVILVK